MKTDEIRDEHGELYAFEVRSDLLSLRKIENILANIHETTEVIRNRLFLGIFNWNTDIRIEFKYKGIDYVVKEAFGDSSMYWIGPRELSLENRSKYSEETKHIHESFLKFKISPVIKFLCDLTSLNFREMFKP